MRLSTAISSDGGLKVLELHRSIRPRKGVDDPQSEIVKQRHGTLLAARGTPQRVSSKETRRVTGPRQGSGASSISSES